MTSTVAVFVGTRPECIKLAPVVRALEASPSLRPIVVDAGQHREMLDQAIEHFALRFDHRLAVMEEDQGLAGLTARLLRTADHVLASVRPDLVVVQGDTTTALAVSLAAFYRRIPVAHVEAGLRTGALEAPFPEEGNRLVASRLSTLHFAPTERARGNLLAEGVRADAVEVTGNTVVDALLAEVERQRDPEVEAATARALAELGLSRVLEPSRRFVLVTAHRRESLADGLDGTCAALRELAERGHDVDFVFATHLNPRVAAIVRDRLANVARVQLVGPLRYDHFVALLRRCHVALTDSGGVQEEAATLGRPLLVSRAVTERPEAIDAGVARLVGTSTRGIVEELERLLSDDAIHRSMARPTSLYGDGRAAARIVGRIERHLGAIAR